MRTKYIVAFVLLNIVAWGIFDFLVQSSKQSITEAITTTTPVTKPIKTAATPVESIVSSHVESAAIGSNFWINKSIKTLRAQNNNLNPDVLRASLNAYLKAEKLGINDKQILTIVDYSKPSSERRLWVIDMKKLKVILHTWVAHGTNSGGANATSFSNQPRSLKSSLGVFITDAPYIGGKGYSLRIKGLEHNVNDNAYNRSIVFHGAWYVNSDFASDKGRMGRSWGCFAVDNAVVKKLINTIKEKSLVVAYYPDKNWLKHSSFIN